MNRLAYRCLAAVGLLAAALSFSNVQAQQAQQAAGGQQGGQAGQQQSSGKQDDDVIDAEFTESK